MNDIEKEAYLKSIDYNLYQIHLQIGGYYKSPKQFLDDIREDKK